LHDYRLDKQTVGGGGGRCNSSSSSTVEHVNVHCIKCTICLKYIKPNTCPTNDILQLILILHI